MDFIIDFWYIILAALVIGALLGLAVYKFLTSPAPEQLAKVREWLLWAVTEAERQLGGGTGQLKLRQVYDLFVVRFPWLAKIIPFCVFSDLVDDALVEMREMLAQNKAAQAHVEGAGANED